MIEDNSFFIKILFLDFVSVYLHLCIWQRHRYCFRARQTEQCVQMDFRPLLGLGWTSRESVFSYSKLPLFWFTELLPDKIHPLSKCRSFRVSLVVECFSQYWWDMQCFRHCGYISVAARLDHGYWSPPTHSTSGKP